LIESAGKSTKIDESLIGTPAGKEPGLNLPSGESSMTKKRLFSEIELSKEEINLFKPPIDDRFNSLITSQHNDLVKDPITLKRAPLNHEILEELESIRINYKGAAAEIEKVDEAIKFLKNVSLPIFDTEQFMENLSSLPDQIRHKIQEFVARGSIDDLNLLKVKTPLWEFLETPTPTSKAAGD
jgi:hypothetical protein